MQVFCNIFYNFFLSGIENHHHFSRKTWWLLEIIPCKYWIYFLQKGLSLFMVGNNSQWHLILRSSFVESKHFVAKSDLYYCLQLIEIVSMILRGFPTLIATRLFWALKYYPLQIANNLQKKRREHRPGRCLSYMPISFSGVQPISYSRQTGLFQQEVWWLWQLQPWHRAWNAGSRSGWQGLPVLRPRLSRP